jgi:hypothetical protein
MSVISIQTFKIFEKSDFSIIRISRFSNIKMCDGQMKKKMLNDMWITLLKGHYNEVEKSVQSF